MSRSSTRWWSSASGSRARSVLRILPVSTAASSPLPETSPSTTSAAPPDPATGCTS
ncbi:hypothetical protein ACNF49_37010 [Actinomadura sp. ATCC 39365]